MALWGISTTTETAANNYAIPKYQHSVDRNRSPWNTFADVRGWIQRHYGTDEHSGLSSTYYDEVLIPVAGLNTSGVGGDGGSTGLDAATPVAIFFEDPNKASPISVAAGATGIGTGRTAYVHLVWNEIVHCSAGATISVLGINTLGVVTSRYVGYANSVAPSAELAVYTNENGYEIKQGYNGQITNRVAFAFTAPNTGIGTVLAINTNVNVVGTITDFSGGLSVDKTLSGNLLKQVGGAGTITDTSIGIGVTTLTIVA
jgi:hypothetical protein